MDRVHHKYKVNIIVLASNQQLGLVSILIYLHIFLLEQYIIYTEIIMTS